MKKGVVLVVLFTLVLFSLSVVAYTDSDGDDYCVESVPTTYPFTFPAAIGMTSTADLKGSKLVYANSNDMSQLMLFDFDTKQSSLIYDFTTNIASYNPPSLAPSSIRFVSGTNNEVEIKFTDNTYKVININTKSIININNEYQTYSDVFYGTPGIFKINNGYYSYITAFCGPINGICIYRNGLTPTSTDEGVVFSKFNSPGPGWTNYYGDVIIDGGDYSVFFYYSQTSTGYTNEITAVSPAGTKTIYIQPTATGSRSSFGDPDYSDAKNNVLSIYTALNTYSIYDLNTGQPPKITITPLTGSQTEYLKAAMDITRFVHYNPIFPSPYFKFYKDLTLNQNPYDSARLINNPYLVSSTGYYNYADPNANSGPTECPLGGNDCNDNNPNLNVPPCIIPCTDLDGDGYGAIGTDLSSCSGSTTIADCDDTSGNANPGITNENSNPNYCTDGLDNDCDGLIDVQDDNCASITCESNCGSSCFYSTCHDPIVQNCYWVDLGIPGLLGECHTVTSSTVCSDLEDDQIACENQIGCEWDGTTCNAVVADVCGDGSCTGIETFFTCVADCGCTSGYPQSDGTCIGPPDTCDPFPPGTLGCDAGEYCGCNDCNNLLGYGGCANGYVCGDNGCEEFDPGAITSCGDPDNNYCILEDNEFCWIETGVGDTYDIIPAGQVEPFNGQNCCLTGICEQSTLGSGGDTIPFRPGLCELRDNGKYFKRDCTDWNKDTIYDDATECVDVECTLSLGQKIPFYDYLGVLLTVIILAGYYLFRYRRK